MTVTQDGVPARDTKAPQATPAAGSPAVSPLAYHDGEFVPLERALLPVTTQALQYGTGVFEGIRAYAQRGGGLAVFRAEDHYRRLLRSCRTLRIDPGHTVEELCALTAELLRRIGTQEDTYIRPLAYKRALLPGQKPGVGLTGVSDALSVNAFRMGSYTDPAGIRCTISSWRRPSSDALPVRAKVTGGYVNNALAVDEARAAGCEDAILLNSRGQVAEASTSNVFAVLRGRLVTPPVTADLLEGITRDTAVTLAADLLDTPTDFRDLGRDELMGADEVFLTGTGTEIVPVTEIAGRPVGEGVPGPLSTALRGAYQDVVRGGEPRYAHWLHPLNA
ncbi:MULTISPECIES: branched-chain amino acid transaminase [Streptomyces]|uniref:Branched-chain-amino-acid aminotransferase n=1 Tax=Streptomyces griseoaurantiacus TaxID=68213 RepID=A0A1G7C595_9ACTN|nr:MULTISPECIES: branched-chain amino acid transaminase [Streptomyces]NJP70117.1 branched-chain amino acid transaminase [Streptomyces sp. C1-2]GHE37156.1 branched chain amino acid aminotransferase [Streptomyces griseoaurantiacus]MCF0086322.1 Branched-chain-amino-acid aminotransferase [Streptomyces sp. MH192]MCF0100070.1 Branched-chain-amino-acid aminotransferase [Streptomyces sp. MH191]MDX3091950.1 branched-chain amino acid transaminase [Streptomyces sp. ME12-02E]